MKILYIKLKNFSSIFTAMKRFELEINFKKSKNKVILILGGNGSGKTSLLSNLHPFAYPGSMDIRSGASMILEDVEGYKEIHIQDGRDVYEIRHHYTPSSTGGRTIKSFIIKNGEDLNPNGNVTSFKSIILEHLQLETDYLKLTRLGSNVNNLIQMKSTERKQFVSSWLSEIDIYGEYFKKINDKSRTINTLMKSLSSKLDKINVINEDEYVKEIDDLTEEVQSIQNKINDLIRKQTEIETIAKMTYIGDIYELASFTKELIKDTKDKEAKLTKILNKKNYVPDMDNELNILQNKLNSMRMEERTFLMKCNSFLSEMDIYNKRIDEIEILIDNSNNDSTIIDMKSSIISIDKEISELPNTNPKFDLTKEEMLKLIYIIEDIGEKFMDLMSIDKKVINDYFTLYKNKPQLAEKYIVILRDEVMKNNYKLQSSQNDVDKNKIMMEASKVDCTQTKCFYKVYFDNNFDNKLNKDELEKNNKSLNKRIEEFENIINIQNLMNFLNDKVSGLPEKLKNRIKDIAIKSIKINSLDQIYMMRDTIKDDIEILENNLRKDFLLDKKREIEKQINILVSSSNVHHLSKDLANNKSKVLKIKEDYLKSKSLYDELSEQVVILSDRVDEILASKNIYEESIQLEERIYKSNIEIETNKEIIAKIKSNKEELIIIENDLRVNTGLLKIKNNKLQNMKFALKDYRAITTELSYLSDKYDDISYMRKSLSTTEGMPIVFMRLYFKNTRVIINELLDIVYKSNLTLEEFEIDDKEFKIPYRKYGKVIDDIVLASQGENSFISLALSFAFIIRSTKKYNILLLDELDSTLDQRNRGLFIDILENQMDKIDGEQTLLITHNNMFDNYDVDAIILDDNVVLDNYKKLNIIFSAND